MTVTSLSCGPTDGSAAAAALGRLVLNSNDEAGEQGAEVVGVLLLLRLPGLACLEIRCRGINDAGLRALAAALSAPQCAHVRTVDLAGNPFAGSIAGAVVFGNNGRGPLFRFDELRIRR